MFGFTWLFGRLFTNLYFDDAGGNGGGGSTTDNGSGGDQGKDAEKAKTAGEDEKGKKSREVNFTPEQQEHIERVIIPERLNRAKFDADKVAEKARKKAEEEALAKNQEFEKLANSRQEEIVTLQEQLKTNGEVGETLKKYKDVVAGIVKVQTEKLPKAVRTLIEKMDPLEQMQYLTDNAKELNIDIKAVPASETDDKNQDLKKEEVAKARRQTDAQVRGFFH